MPHSYVSEYPDALVLSGVAQFFRDFYKTSDTPEAHDHYPDFFTKDAVFILASRSSKGRDEILATRKSMWAAVSARQHTVIKVFSFGTDSSELMLYGTVAYTLKNGKESVVDWAGRAKLVKEGEDWKFGFYQVYLDTAAQQNTK